MNQIDKKREICTLKVKKIKIEGNSKKKFFVKKKKLRTKKSSLKGKEYI